jgi:hypothetical protein
MGISFFVNGAKIINVFKRVVKLQPYLQHFPVFTEKWINKKAKIYATVLIDV